MQRITVKTSKPYQVSIGKGLSKDIGNSLAKLGLAGNIALITSLEVNDLYANQVEVSLERAGYKVHRYVLREEKNAKNIGEFYDILRFFTVNNISKSDTVLALGGGVVGDLASFCASVYYRGINYVYMPTTLLSMIDTSVGGKNGIDIAGIKNLIGGYYSPKAVYCDINFLNSLEEADWDNGLIELIKYAILIGGDFWKLIDDIDYRKNIEEIIASACSYKRLVVESDEFADNKRQILGLGHTFAHALEHLSGYEVSRSVALSLGISNIAYLSYQKAGLPKRDYEKIMQLLKKHKMKYTCDYKMEEIVGSIISDKRIKNNKLNLAVITAIGACTLESMPVNKIKGFFLN